jgi:hypothetical protein
MDSEGKEGRKTQFRLDDFLKDGIFVRTQEQQGRKRSCYLKISCDMESEGVWVRFSIPLKIFLVFPLYLDKVYSW